MTFAKLTSCVRYWSKALVLSMQQPSGLSLMLETIWLHEYGGDAPSFNAGRAYLSYVDSGDVFDCRVTHTCVLMALRS